MGLHKIGLALAASSKTREQTLRSGSDEEAGAARNTELIDKGL